MSISLITKLRNKFKLARMVYLDLVYFAGVKNLSTQFRDDMLAAYAYGLETGLDAYSYGLETGLEKDQLEVFNKWFKDNYL